MQKSAIFCYGKSFLLDKSLLMDDPSLLSVWKCFKKTTNSIISYASKELVMVNNVNNGKPEHFITKLGNISQITSAIAAIAAVIFTYLTVTTSWKSIEVDKQSKRPYFVIMDPELKKKQVGSSYIITMIIKNIGIHPASNVAQRIIHINTTQTGELKYSDKIDQEPANEIPSASVYTLERDVGALETHTLSQYIVMLLKYKDPILGNEYYQKHYTKWEIIPEKVNNDIYNRHLFVLTNVNEANKIEESFGNIINEFLDPKLTTKSH